MEDRLRECPCGHEAHIIFEDGIKVSDPWSVACKKFDCPWVFQTFPSREKAISEWNTRATDPLMEEIDQLRVQLAGCGVAALSNTHESRAQQRINKGNYGWSPSYQDVFDAVGREIKYRELMNEMAEALEELDDMFDPTSRVGEIINKALKEYREMKDAK